jgi:predicted transposase YdaD
MEEANQLEVEFMIMNLEVTLNEMQQQVKKEGIKEGIKEGELKKALETAREALKEGISVDVICKITALDKEIVQKIKNELQNIR